MLKTLYLYHYLYNQPATAVKNAAFSPLNVSWRDCANVSKTSPLSYLTLCSSLSRRFSNTSNSYQSMEKANTTYYLIPLNNILHIIK